MKAQNLSTRIFAVVLFVICGVGVYLCKDLTPQISYEPLGPRPFPLGALALYNINPGPMMFVAQADIVWGLIASLLFANIVLLLLNLPLIGIFIKMLSVPMWALVPFIAVISAIGVYSINASSFDLFAILVIGIFGYILRKLEFPMAPLILGFVLGELLEVNLRRALSISSGDFSILYQSAICKVLLVGVVIVIFVLPLIKYLRGKTIKSTK